MPLSLNHFSERHRCKVYSHRNDTAILTQNPKADTSEIRG